MAKPENISDDQYKIYLEERKMLVDAQRESINFFDKTILTLAAGVFGLSITFIRYIAPEIKAETMWILATAWGGFCISLLSTLISLLTSQLACANAIKIIEWLWFKDEKEKCSKQPNNIAAIVTTILTYISIITFTLGVIFLASFSFRNLPIEKGDVIMANADKKDLNTGGFTPQKQPQKPQDIKKGFTPNKPPIPPKGSEPKK